MLIGQQVTTSIRALAISAVVVGSAACTQENLASPSPSPTTVDPAAPAQATGELTVRIGTIVNTSAPTVDRDQQLADVLAQVVERSSDAAAVTFEVTTIDEVEDVDSSITALAGRGVTVIATLCDDATVPSIVDAAVAQGLLAITACVTLPAPQISSDSPLFIDLAGLHDASNAVARWLAARDSDGIATISSDLVPDVAESCNMIEAGLADLEIGLDLSLEYTELVDEPGEVIEAATTLLATTDAIVLCALPPASGDMVGALRSAGLTQPIVVPWFTDGQVWDATTDEVFLVSPASRHGDDPEATVNDVFEVLGPSAQAVDIVTADSIAMMSEAALRARSTGSSRLASTLRQDAFAAVSGELELEEVARVAGRDYRVIEVTNGNPRFLELVDPTG